MNIWLRESHSSLSNMLLALNENIKRLDHTIESNDFNKQYIHYCEIHCLRLQATKGDVIEAMTVKTLETTLKALGGRIQEIEAHPFKYADPDEYVKLCDLYGNQLDKYVAICEENEGYQGAINY